jgi:hypothetical protein
MDTWQISSVLTRHAKARHVFVGCFPSDMIPVKDRYPYAMVVNTDSSARKGRHWVAIYVPSPYVVEYFDSFGMEPNKNIKDFLKKFLIRRRSSVMLQSIFSDVCGMYCIYFIIKRCCGESLSSIVSHLQQKRCPDSVIKLFCAHLFK